MAHSPGQVIFFSSEFPPRGTGPNPIAFLPFLPNYVYIILTALVVQSPSVSFWLVFSKNCATCRYIFDVFMGGDELYNLLLHHLDPNPQCLLFFKDTVFNKEVSSFNYNLLSQIRLFPQETAGVWMCVSMDLTILILFIYTLLSFTREFEVIDSNIDADSGYDFM